MSEMHLDERLLIRRSQNGDRHAFDALVRMHEVRAYQFAYRLTRNPEEASDVVADAFLRVYNALPNFKGQSAFTTWLFRILTNCYLDLKKREKNRIVLSLESTVQTEDGEVERQVEDQSASPLEETTRHERARSLEAALAKLPEYQQAMILLYHAEMLSYEEIAAALDLPVGTVKSRLNRARLSLRQILEKDEELFRLS
jgi:RNA polymerase sigma-70 factor, ECF subfamily